MRKIKWCVDVATGAVNPDGEGQIQEKKSAVAEPITQQRKRESILDKLAENTDGIITLKAL